MKKTKIYIPLAALFVAGLYLTTVWNAQSGAGFSHTGMCDASAAIRLDGDRFLIANDEDNVLRVYHRDRSGPPSASVDLTTFLADGERPGEADIEAAARAGNRVYWITSHGANKKGKFRPERRRFFVTDIEGAGQELAIQPVGRPYAGLLEDLAGDERYGGFDLEQAATLAPKEAGGLNIEGLATAPEGHLLVGFRNPIPGGKALLVPLLNPDDLAEGRRARFGDPILLDLAGLGIRSLEYWREQLLIVAGPSGSDGESFLYVWDGGEASPRRLEVSALGGLNPEAMAVIPQDGGASLWIVSDDGGREFEGCECKNLEDPARRQFRAVLWPMDGNFHASVPGRARMVAR